MADRLMIKTQSACVYGEDLAPKLVGFRPDKSIVFDAYAINDLLLVLGQKLGTARGLTEIKDLCTWIMKRLLRTGFELVMEKERAYTRDLYPCYAIFSKYYPEHEGDMRRALELALNPVSDKDVILKVTDGFGEWLSREAAKKYPR